MSHVYVRSGYHAEVYLDHSEERFSGTILRITKRYGTVNNVCGTPVYSNPLIHFKDDKTGEIYHFDAGFVTKCVHPSKVGKPYVIYPVERERLYKILRIKKNLCNTKKSGVFVGTVNSLWYEALPGVVRDYGDIVFDHYRLKYLFENSNVAHYVGHGCYRIKKKSLRRLIKQNINRMKKPAKQIHEEQTRINTADELDYLEDLEEMMEI